MNCFHTQFDGFFCPNRLVWEALPEQPGDGSALVGIDPEVLADAGVVDALPPDQAAEVQAATGTAPEGSEEKTPEKKEEKESVPDPVMQLVEAGLLSSPCNTSNINEAITTLDHLPQPLSPEKQAQRDFLEARKKEGDAGLTVLNLQIREYLSTKREFSDGKMREVVTRSQENIIEHAYSSAKDIAKKALGILDKGMEKHPYGMLAAGAVLLYLAFTNKDKIGSLWKWGAGLTAVAIMAPMAMDALKHAPYVGDELGPSSAAEKERAEKESKIQFLTGNLPHSFIEKVRQEDKNSGISGDQGLLGFYELCQMSVAEFVEQMSPSNDHSISDAEVGVNFGDQAFRLTGEERYKFGKELIRVFGFDPESPSDLEEFKKRFGNNNEKLWMAAKVFPSSQES